MASRHSEFRRRTSSSATTEGGTKYAITDGPNYTADRETVSADETYLIRSEDVLDFLQESMPAPIFLFERFSLISPYRRMPGAPWMVTERVELKPFNKNLPGDPFGGDAADADTAAPDDTYSDFYEARITYRPTLESIEDQDPNDPETFLETQKNAGSQFLSVPPSKTSVTGSDANGNFPDGNSVGPPARVNQEQQMGIAYPVSIVDYTFTWPLVLNPNFAKFDAALGKVNGTLQSLFDNSPLGTVLFMGYNAKRRFIWNGFTLAAQPYEIQFKFSKRAINRTSDFGIQRVFGWNHQFNTDSGDWELITMANGQPIHDSTDFLALFVFP